jgi:peptidoglycan-associated lipoprotein
MKLWFRAISFIFLAFAISMATASCSSKEREQDQPLITAEEGHKLPPPKQEDRIEEVDLAQAFFDYDKSVLKSEGKKALRKNATWLKSHPEATLQIEGHCDELGTPEYNLKLGQRRADSAKRYLISLGISPSRLTTVSYGSDPGSSPDIRARNRHAAFVVVYSK